MVKTAPAGWASVRFGIDPHYSGARSPGHSSFSWAKVGTPRRAPGEDSFLAATRLARATVLRKDFGERVPKGQTFTKYHNVREVVNLDTKSWERGRSFTLTRFSAKNGRLFKQRTTDKSRSECVRALEGRHAKKNGADKQISKTLNRISGPSGAAISKPHANHEKAPNLCRRDYITVLTGRPPSDASSHR